MDLIIDIKILLYTTSTEAITLLFKADGPLVLKVAPGSNSFNCSYYHLIADHFYLYLQIWKIYCECEFYAFHL